MTARSPYQAAGGDVAATLSELERKLRELEQDLNATARLENGPPTPALAARPERIPSAPPPAASAPDADALIARARARLGPLDAQVDELLRFREQLHRTARELEAEYTRVLTRIGAPTAAPATPAPASPREDTPFEGTIVVDAGPFTDIAALSAFEQGLARVPGAEDVYVSAFEGNRALVELRLAQPVALVREMRHAVGPSFVVTEAAAGRLRLDVTAIHPGR